MTNSSDAAEVRRAHRTELSPLLFLERSVLVYPDKVAVVHEDRRYTYREFGERVNRLASALRAAGLRKGDRVAFICPNIPALLEAHYGVPAAGGVLVALNYRLNAQDVGFILEHSGARFLFVDHEFEHLAEDARVERTVRIDDTGVPEDPYEAFLAGGSAEPVASELGDEDEPISINYTSGTTGTPKGAVYHYRGAYLNALGEVIETRLTPESVKGFGLRKRYSLKPLPAIQDSLGPPAEAGTRSPSGDASDCNAVRCSAHITHGLFASRIDCAIHELLLEGREERLGRRVVIAYAGSPSDWLSPSSSSNFA